MLSAAWASFEDEFKNESTSAHNAMKWWYDISLGFASLMPPSSVNVLSSSACRTVKNQNQTGYLITKWNISTLHT